MTIQRYELALLAAIMAFATLILGRQIGVASAEFDEQVYLASADTLTRGFDLGRDVFTSQPPLFLTMLQTADNAFGGSATLMRLLLVLLTIAGSLGSWALVRARAGAVPALVTALLVALAPGVVEAAAVVSADVPCVVFGTLALLAASSARRHPAWALAAGVLISAAILTKLLAVPFALAIAVGAFVHRAPCRAYVWFGCGTALAFAAVLLVYADVLGPLWHGAVALHLQARGAQVDLPTPSILVAAILIISAYVGLLAVLAAGVLEVRRAELAGWLRERADLIALFAGGFALCAVQRPLLNHHLVIVAWPLALLAGSALPARLASRRTLALACAGGLLIAPWAIHGRDTLDHGERGSLERVAEIVAMSTPGHGVVVSDLPAVPVLADRTSAPGTVDPSYVRVQTGELSLADVTAAARGADAVVVGRAFRGLPGLQIALGRRFTHSVTLDRVTVWSAPRSS
ncbi:MAG TPA: glycosyltransferase family 39 protein [Baekduia sp.]|nr:glycosyltransferase family 39 protein [Baekduia sp.]